MATAAARTVRLRRKADGQVYWLEHRTGYRGREFNFGGGWRTDPEAAFAAAEKSGALNRASA